MMNIKTYAWQTKTRPGYLGIELLGGKKKEQSGMNSTKFKNTPNLTIW